MPAAEFLASLGMSDRAQAMLFEAFARSFFAQPGALSAGELIAMFHYYFLGNPEGIGFDAPDTDYLTCIWAPFAAYLEKHGATVRTGTPARSLASGRGPPLAGRDRRRRRLSTRHVVLATEPGALRDLFAASPAAARRRTPARREGRAGRGGPAVRRDPALARPRRRAGAPDVQRGQPGADAGLDHRVLAAGTALGAVGGPHRRVGRRAALLRVHGAGRRDGDGPDARRAGGAVARDRGGAGRAPAGADGGDGADVPARRRRHPAAARGRGARDPGGRRPRRDAVPDRAHGAGGGVAGCWRRTTCWPRSARAPSRSAGCRSGACSPACAGAAPDRASRRPASGRSCAAGCAAALGELGVRAGESR